MIRRAWITRLIAVAALAAGTTDAKAGLLPVSVSVTPEAGNFRWTYAVVLPTDMKLQAGDYFTIYDFGGFVPGSTSAPDGWNFTPNAKTPDRLIPNDDPNIPNLTWTYNGPTIPTGQVGLGNFWAVSNYSQEAESFFTARNPRVVDGQFDSNITTVNVPTGTPTTSTGVPEPTTLALAGLGLPLVGLARRWRKKA
jgi:hypothetical protein